MPLPAPLPENTARGAPRNLPIGPRAFVHKRLGRRSTSLGRPQSCTKLTATPPFPLFSGNSRDKRERFADWRVVAGPRSGSARSERPVLRACVLAGSHALRGRARAPTSAIKAIVMWRCGRGVEVIRPLSPRHPSQLRQSLSWECTPYHQNPQEKTDHRLDMQHRGSRTVHEERSGTACPPLCFS